MTKKSGLLATDHKFIFYGGIMTKRGTYDKTLIRCSLEDCRANCDGHCVALNDNDFGDRSCPFYKKRIDDNDNSWNRENLKRSK